MEALADRLEDHLEQLEDDLLGRAFLYDRPADYREAVEDAMSAFRMLLQARRVAV
jgi:hypothetical protein